MVDEFDKNKIDKEITSLLKDFYQPNAADDLPRTEKEFEVFFSGIENKLENDTMHKKVSLLAADLEDQFINRQQRLFQAKNRFESGFAVKRKNKFKSRKLVRNSILIVSFITCLTLASIATFKNNDAFKVVDFEEKDKIWQELDLDKEQRDKIDEIERQWLSYKNFENDKIQIVKTRLMKEVNKEEPDLALISKYQREIFDIEIHLKQQKFNSDLEKRFVLNHDQNLEMIRSN